MRFTLDRGGGGGAGEAPVAGIILVCCYAAALLRGRAAVTRQAAALYKLLYRLPHHSAMSLAPQPAALRFRECCRYVMLLEASREAAGDVAKNPSLEQKS